MDGYSNGITLRIHFHVAYKNSFVFNYLNFFRKDIPYGRKKPIFSIKTKKRNIFLFIASILGEVVYQNMEMGEWEN